MFENEYPYLNGNGNGTTTAVTLPDTIRPALLDPQICLFGSVCDSMFWSFKKQLEEALKFPGELCLELSTTGGDAETGRRIAEEIRICREYRGRDILFFGKTFIYSAGITIMAAFEKEQRYLSRDAHLLIHSRRIEKNLNFSGPLSSNIAVAEEMLASLKSGMNLEHAGFESLARGCTLSVEEIERRAGKNWYLTAEEACKIGLVKKLL